MNDPKEIINILEKFKSFIKTDFPRLAARRTEGYVRNNFRQQGYADNGVQAWQPRKNTDKVKRALLIGERGGHLRDSIKVVASADIIRVETPVVYAQIHNEGGTIVQSVSAKQRAFFFAKHTEAKKRKQLDTAERWKRMALSKTLTIEMPKRQFMPKPSDPIPKELADTLQRDIEKKLESLF